MRSLVFVAMLFVGTSLSAAGQIAPAAEEHAIGSVLARFYDGWNEHDADKMVSAYAEDIDHIDVFGEWQKGRAPLGRARAPSRRSAQDQPEDIQD